MILKAEIHCHIEGAASPELVARQGGKYGVDITPAIRDGAYVWHDFTSFLAAYDLAASLFRSREDYALLAETYLTSLASEGAIYSEFFISTDHALSAGLDPADYVEGLGEGIERARANTGIEGRMIATGLRHMGPEAVMRAARWIVDHPHPLVTGFGMAGDERMHHPRDFAGAFDLARDSGLGITVHAGELEGPQSVRDALDYLKPSRIGHGVRSIEDMGLVERIATQGVVLEICPASNIALQVFPDFASHPFRRLEEAGCKVTLNSDDPPHFHTSIKREYEIAAVEFGYGEGELLQFTRNAVEAAFIDGDSKARLLEKLGAGRLS
ncbi:MAG: adenosine deaminase [Nitratireductor sp.]